MFAFRDLKQMAYNFMSLYSNSTKSLFELVVVLEIEKKKEFAKSIPDTAKKSVAF